MKPISVDTLPAPQVKVSLNGERVKTTIHVGRTIEIGKENADAIAAQQGMYKAKFGKSITDNEAVMLMVPETTEKYREIAKLTDEIHALIKGADSDEDA